MVEPGQVHVRAGDQPRGMRALPDPVRAGSAVVGQPFPPQGVVRKHPVVGGQAGRPVAPAAVEAGRTGDGAGSGIGQAAAHVLEVAGVADPVEVGARVPGAVEAVPAVEMEHAAVFLAAVVGDRDFPDLAFAVAVGQVVRWQVLELQGAAAGFGQVAEFAAQQEPAPGHDPRAQGHVVVGRQVEVDRLLPVEAVAAVVADGRVQQAGLAAVVDGELEPGHIQHRDLAQVQGGSLGGAEPFLHIDVDLARAQFPQPLVRGAGGIRGPVERAELALQLGPRGAAAAALVNQLVAHVLDAVGVLLLVALQPLAHQPHARVLVADAPFGGVGAGLGIDGEVVGAEELVATAQGDVAVVVHHLVVDAAEFVTRDVGGMLVAVGGGAHRRRRIGEHRHRVVERAQAPHPRALVGECGQRNGNAQRQWQQSEGWAHSGIFRSVQKRPPACRIHCEAAIRSHVGHHGKHGEDDDTTCTGTNGR